MLKIVNPATEQLIREVEEDTPAGVAEKFRRARVAQEEWAARGVRERVEALRRFRGIAESRKEDWAKITTSEVGKPIRQSHNEVNGFLGRIDFFLGASERTLADELVWKDPGDKLEERIVHEPLGVIANISAWNYPYLVGSNVFVPGLIAGNAVLYKPSEFATLTGLAIADGMYEAGVPRDVFVPVIGTGAVGAELLKQPVRGVFFTGSYATGAKIAESVARRMLKVQLELGGKDPAYIADDADPKAAAEATADGAMYNAGQSCCSVERIYVQQKIHDAFVDAFVSTVKGFAVGDPMDEKTYIGPLTRAPQLDVLERQVQDAVAKGAKLLCGGRRVAGRKGYYFEPAVLVSVNHTMELMREESFGPVIGIQAVSEDDEAARLMNDTEYGLTAGVYTRDRARADRLLKKVNAGSAYWNCCDRVSPRLPWSGRGHSGLGCTLSTHGILAFTQPKGWHLRG